MALAQRAGESLLMTGEIEPIEDVVASIARRHAGRRAARRAALFRPGAFAMAVVGPGGDAGAPAGDPLYGPSDALGLLVYH